LRKILSENIKDRRRKLGITQEKLAELVDLSTQMINTIEGCRAWVSDKTLTALAEILGVEVYQLFMPITSKDVEERDVAPSRQLDRLRREIKADIIADIDTRFMPFLEENKKKK
jgi:transcriptional regulator with XRE-family HTH domain